MVKSGKADQLPPLSSHFMPELELKYSGLKWEHSAIIYQLHFSNTKRIGQHVMSNQCTTAPWETNDLSDKCFGTSDQPNLRENNLYALGLELAWGEAVIFTALPPPIGLINTGKYELFRLWHTRLTACVIAKGTLAFSPDVLLS